MGEDRLIKAFLKALPKLCDVEHSDLLCEVSIFALIR